MRSPSRRPSQSDIAKRLGVSVSTVSRALANESGISDALRLEVQRAAKDLGYRGKAVAHFPAQGQRAVALMPLGGATGGLSNFYHDIILGMKQSAIEQGIELTVRVVNEHALTLDIVKEHISAFGAKAVLLTGIDPWDELVDWCRDAGVAPVLVNGTDPDMRCSSVAPANFFGAHLATRKLIEAGHKRIAHYTNWDLRPTITERRRGFETAAADARDTGVEGIVIDSRELREAQLCEELLSGRLDVTALFCWNDIVAVGVIEKLTAAEAAIPETFSIIGFDDMPLGEMVSPRLSTIRVNRSAIGRAAIGTLVDSLAAPGVVHQVEIGLSYVPGGTIQQIG